MGTRRSTTSERRRTGTPGARREKTPPRAQQPVLPGLEGALFADGQPPLAALGASVSASVALSRPPADVAPIGQPAHGHAHGHTSGRECFGELRAALAEGWEIVQPIFARPLWSATDDSITAFNFVLRRERATRLVTVPEGRSVERFIRERHLKIDYRH